MDRCIESVSALLSGMYPPKDRWIWGGENNDPELSKIWQPFPIETFMPKDEDTLLVPHKKCPKVDDEHKRISDSPEVRKIIKEFHQNPIYPSLKPLFDDPIDSIYRGQQFWDTLKIEQEQSPKMIWDKFNNTFTQEMAIKALEPMGIGSYVWDWNRDFIRKIRLGRLVETLTKNMENAIDGKEEEKRVYVYSTHDSIVVPLLQALDLKSYNNMTPAYGAAILIELHQLTDGNHTVRIFYYNNTLEKPYPYLNQTLKEFQRHNQKWFYSDFDKECGIKSGQNLLLSEMTFLVIGIAIGIGLIGLNIAAVQYMRSRKNRLEITR